MIYILGPCLQKGALSTGDCKGRESHDGRECVIECVCVDRQPDWIGSCFDCPPAWFSVCVSNQV